MAALSFLYSQLFVTPPIPTHDFTEQTIIITGGNRGLGYEAARHILRLNAARVILAVRSISSGQTAKETLERDTKRWGAVDVYELDMASHASVQAFVTEMKTVNRLDAVLLNAGIFTQDFVLQGGYESTLAVNVVHTFLLAALLVPVLRRAAEAHGILPRLSIVASDRHVMNNLPEWKEENTFRVLNDPKRAKMSQRYVLRTLQ
jgi:NAD(P)-dependent dehydrogenase (short-subunit alcohol dehydrogenase family)